MGASGHHPHGGNDRASNTPAPSPGSTRRPRRKVTADTVDRSVVDFGAIYAETRERVADLTRNLAAADLEREVPATPGWRVCDVAAHLAGVAADVLAGNLPGGPGEEWTAAQVESRRACTIGEVLDEWADTAVELEPKIAAAGPPMGFLVADVATHEHDVRGALRQSGFRDSAGVE